MRSAIGTTVNPPWARLTAPRLVAAAVALALVAGCHSTDREPEAARQHTGQPSPPPIPTPIAIASSSPMVSPPPASTEGALAAVVAATGAGGTVPIRPTIPFPKRPCRIAVLGDSLTDPKSAGGGYLDVVQRQCPTCGIDNFGKGASMVVQMRRRFLKLVQPVLDKYSHLIVFGGVNDVYSDVTAGRTPEKIASDLAIIYESARAGGTQVVAINISPWGGFKRYFNKRRGKATLTVNGWLAQQQRVGNIDYLVDAYSALSCGVPERLCPHFEWPFKDGIHFGPSGHEVLGRQVVSTAFANCPSTDTDH